jgi:hypothetical protein
MVVEAELSIWPMPYFLVMIVNLNITYRELATSFPASSRADPITWALWIILWAVYNRLWFKTGIDVKCISFGTC